MPKGFDIDDLLKPGRDPTQNEQWVACAMANHALQKLCIELIVEFTTYEPPDPIDLALLSDDAEHPATPSGIVDRLLAGVADRAELLNWTDIEPGRDFNPDVAKRVALEMIEDHLAEITRTALNRR